MLKEDLYSKLFKMYAHYTLEILMRLDFSIHHYRSAASLSQSCVYNVKIAKIRKIFRLRRENLSNTHS